MTFIRATVFVLAIGFILALAAPVPAQRVKGKAEADAPTELKDLGKLLKLIKPAGERELALTSIPWMIDVAKARQQAAAEGKLVAHMSCTRHPLGSC